MKKLLNKIYLMYIDLKQGMFNIWYWFKIITKTYYWDSEFLLNIEEHYLKQALKYFIWSDLASNNDIIMRDIKLCLSLITIIKNEAVDMTYINTKNYKRFIPILDMKFLHPDICPKNTINTVERMIAIEKAFHLYNKIRAYRMQTWWD